MSHIHIPDGVLPAWLVLLGWLGAAAVLAWALFALRGSDARRQIPLLGVMAALMLVGMSTEFVPIGYHINLTIIAGIVLGPALGFIAAFVVNLILALFGHGGVTVVGLNTLVIGAECALAFLVFRAFYRAFGGQKPRIGLLAGGATVLTLFITTLLLIGIVAIGNAKPTTQMHPAPAVEGGLGAALSEGILDNELLGGEEEHASVEVNVGRFAGLALGLGSIGWIMEAVITGVVVQFVWRVQPNLIVSRRRASAFPAA
ncbi:MAG: energy-coupling factor ABC transporter permease [Anaerolineae bacterium]|nr:energy-coupling factor ABC transporter permease [Anaerolineae bacterium]